MSALLKLLGFGAGLYLLILLVLYFMQRSMIYLPNPTRPEPAAWHVADMSAVSLKTEDELSLLAWWKPPADGRPAIVFFHGNGGHIGHRGSKVRGFLDRGYGVLLVAWRGYGGNEGAPTEAGLYADGRAALRFLEQQGIGTKEIVLYGESLGSGVAVELASRGAGQALVLEAPFTSLAAAAADRFPLFPVRWLIRDRFDSQSKIGKVTAPLLIIHGEADVVLPVSLGRALLEKANEPKQGVFIPRAGHNNLYDFGGGGIVLAFLDKIFP
ncbi:MAG: alpha/beta hydrolase [Proteobacteria bacterium]|nr:alpha/beta hydrolase [Pseudomonadota bacterium]